MGDANRMSAAGTLPAAPRRARQKDTMWKAPAHPWNQAAFFFLFSLKARLPAAFLSSCDMWALLCQGLGEAEPRLPTSCLCSDRKPLSPLVAMVVAEEELAEQWGFKCKGAGSLQGFVRGRRRHSTLFFLLPQDRTLRESYKDSINRRNNNQKTPQRQNTSEKKAKNKGKCVRK